MNVGNTFVLLWRESDPHYLRVGQDFPRESEVQMFQDILHVKSNTCGFSSHVIGNWLKRRR